MKEIKRAIEDYWRWIVGGFAGLSLVLFIMVIFSFSKNSAEESLTYEDLMEEITSDESSVREAESMVMETISSPEELSHIFVDIKGAVQFPGVYEIESSKRVIDAVEEAGGLSEEADSNSVNLAQKLADQMVIYVAEVGEEAPLPQQNEEESGENSLAININTAEKSELIQLKGIGEAKAQNILTYREENGSFSAVEEIKEVSGIGDAIFEGIKSDISVN